MKEASKNNLNQASKHLFRKKLTEENSEYIYVIFLLI